LDLKKVGVLGVLAALLLAFGAFGLHKANNASAIANSVSVTPVQINLLGTGNIQGNWLDDTLAVVGASESAVLSVAPATGSSASATLSGCVLIANLDGQAVTGTATSCSVVLGDVDTIAETTVLTGTVMCLTPGNMVATLTQGGVSTSFAFRCGQSFTATTVVETNATTGAVISVLETFPVGTNTSNADITITVRDQNGFLVDGVEVLGIASTGIIETPGGITINDNLSCKQTTPTSDTDLLHEEINTGSGGNTTGVATFTYCASVGSTLGSTTVTFVIVNDAAGLADTFATVTFTIVGPPTSLTITASPTSVICGEKITVSGSVKDAIGQNVSDGTVVSMFSNHGTQPISGSITRSGSFSGFVLSGNEQAGPNEVVVGVDTNGDDFPDLFAQASFTCTMGGVATTTSPSVTAPNTGTAGIRPPNTGDAGLAANGSSTALFSVAGLVAFAIAGLATVKFARR